MRIPERGRALRAGGADRDFDILSSRGPVERAAGAAASASAWRSVSWAWIRNHSPFGLERWAGIARGEPGRGLRGDRAARRRSAPMAPRPRWRRRGGACMARDRRGGGHASNHGAVRQCLGIRLYSAMPRVIIKSRAEPSRAEPSRAEPSRAEPSRAEPSRAEPSRAEPSRAEPSRAEPSRAEPVFTSAGASHASAERTPLGPDRLIPFIPRLPGRSSPPCDRQVRPPPHLRRGVASLPRDGCDRRRSHRPSGGRYRACPEQRTGRAAELADVFLWRPVADVALGRGAGQRWRRYQVPGASRQGNVVAGARMDQRPRPRRRRPGAVWRRSSATGLRCSGTGAWRRLMGALALGGRRDAASRAELEDGRLAVEGRERVRRGRTRLGRGLRLPAWAGARLERRGDAARGGERRRTGARRDAAAWGAVAGGRRMGRRTPGHGALRRWVRRQACPDARAATGRRAASGGKPVARKPAVRGRERGVREPVGGSVCSHAGRVNAGQLVKSPAGISEIRLTRRVR